MSDQTTPARKDYLGGVLLVAIGIGAMIEGSRYSVGTLQKMGPGFFPLALGAILTLIGVAIALIARLEARPSPASSQHDSRAPEWRGWLCITGSIVAFIGLGQHGGLVPATVALVFVSALGDRQNTLKSAATVTAVMLAICICVFWWALKINFPLFRWE